MKKTILTIVAVVFCFVAYSCKSNETVPETTITVTSDKQTSFDFYHIRDSKAVKHLKGVKTPYEIKLSLSDDKFIFRQNEAGTKMKVELNNEAGGLSADFPVTVVIVENGKMSAFGTE